jgi:hypothetical protein
MEKIPDSLYEDIIRQDCVIFAGAGISTEGSKWPGTPTFYDTIKEKAKYPKSSAPPSFADLMQYFCEHVDGGQRNRLTREAICYIETFSVPGESNTLATIFHHELAQIPYFDRFVTTNWDPFLEQSLNVLVPMVEDRDLAFWDDSKRQVLKIHGCITRPYTLVATREDYEVCIKRSPLIFNKLRDLMATKTFIFAGYSLQDSDFQLILDEISNSLGRFKKLAYAIDPNATDETAEYWKSRGIQVHKIYGGHFLDLLRQRLIEENLLPTQKFVRFLQEERKRIHSVHFEREQGKTSGSFASAMYQDGLQHALTDVFVDGYLGKKQEDFEKELAGAQKHLELMHKKKDYIEIAYWSGRCEVLRRFCERDTSTIPAYFHPDNLVPIRRYIRGGDLE